MILRIAHLLLASGLLAVFTAGAADVALGECVAGSESIQLTFRADAGVPGTIAISAGTASSRQTFNLASALSPQMNTKLAAPLKLDAVDSSDANNLVAGFAVDFASGDVKWISAWLCKSGGRWTLRGEWSVEKFNHRELGERNESQTFAFETGGVLRRNVSRNNIEGIKTTCPQGCCVVWQTRTMVTEEIETLTWNTTTRTADRKTFQKWYVTQYGDGLLSIAQKVFGNPQKMATLLNLNPELQKLERLEENQKVLIEKVAVRN